ncbi:MAG: hypothetical protein HDT13_04485 [Butyrivibrio sp.]|nr:hypothetical protein [Butyrivibrio sp.]
MNKNADVNGDIENSGGRRRMGRMLALGASLFVLALLVVFAVVKINKKPYKPPVDVGEAAESLEKNTEAENQSTNIAGNEVGSTPEKRTDNETEAGGDVTQKDVNGETTADGNGETAKEQTEEPEPPAGTQAPPAGQKPEAPNPDTQAPEPSTGENKTEAGTETAAPPATQVPSGSVEDKAKYYISQMTTEEKVAGLFFVHPEVINGGLQADESTREALSRYPVGGIIYFGNNIQSEEQLTNLLAQTKAYSKYPLFLGVDEEGGKVARVAQAFDSVENTGDASVLGALGNPASAYSAYGKIGTYLGKYGFNVDFAPVADIYNENNSMFEKRSFGKDVKLVSDYVYQAVKGLQDKGISACAKHFPGHGNAKGDSHNGMAVSLLTREELLSHELLPFKSAISANTDFIMMGHISLPNVLSDNTPATLSYDIITGILRNELGYDGIIITDAMRMSAVSEKYSSAEAAVMAIKAECDMVLMPVDFNEAYQGVLNAVKSGEISIERIEASLMRIYRVKCRNM